MKLRAFFYLFSLILFGSTAHASSDAQLWIDAGVAYRPTKKVKLALVQNIRLADNISQLDSLKTDLETEWKFKKWLRLGAGYRFSMETNKKGVLKPSHRLHIQGRLKESWGPVNISYRLRFQEGMEADDDGLELKHTLRNRIKAEFDTDTLVNPALAFELFTRFADKQAVQWQKTRITTGLEIRPHKTQIFNVYYRLQVPTFDLEDPLEHIVGLSYTYRVPRKKK